MSRTRFHERVIQVVSFRIFHAQKKKFYMYLLKVLDYFSMLKPIPNQFELNTDLWSFAALDLLGVNCESNEQAKCQFAWVRSKCQTQQIYNK